MPAELLANVIRGNIVESVHTGHIAMVDGEGNMVHQVGDPSTVTYFRSACKAFQLIPCITSGAADAFAFDDEEIALGCASHSGEKRHVEIAQRMLSKAGFTESDLRCGVHSPFNEAEAKRMVRNAELPNQLHNNCSGKHAAMLALGKHIGDDPTAYEALESRVQRRILRCVSDFTGVAEGEIAVGIDGCAAPNFALPLAAMAKSFANLVHPESFHESVQAACSRVVNAMIRFPELIGGTGRLDTMIMRAAEGRAISKVGADGVWLAAVLPCERYPTGLGVALKVADGDDHRGRPVIAVELLRRLGVLSADNLKDVSPTLLKNRRGDVVGRVEAVNPKHLPQ